jgi:hypothetical protein
MRRKFCGLERTCRAFVTNEQARKQPLKESPASAEVKQRCQATSWVPTTRIMKDEANRRKRASVWFVSDKVWLHCRGEVEQQAARRRGNLEHRICIRRAIR